MIEHQNKLKISKESEFLSRKVGHLENLINKYKLAYSGLWEETEADFPQFGKAYSEEEQKDIECELSAFVDKQDVILKDYSLKKDKQKLILEDFVKELKKFGKHILKLSDVNLDLVFKEDFVDSTRMFIENIKKFDPSLKIEDVYQALRNVWIMNSLQAYLNLDIRYSDAIFAYSMIYPYTDNYLDDVAESVEKKYLLITNLKNWLEGLDSSYKNQQEEKIFRLIKSIEEQYDRDLFPGVFQSLLAIFNAQIRSLVQQRKQSPSHEIDILDISLEKGGTSVLADGFLVNGHLEEDQADFCFGFGVLLQLADDVQDVDEDKRNNHITIFSQNAGEHSLDKMANKLLNFISKILDLKLDEQTLNRKSLKDIILKNCYYLVLEAIGKNRTYYSEEYVREVQNHFPVRFFYLNKLKKTLKEKILDKREYVTDFDLISAILLTITSRTLSGR